jgi:hypothetical protein
MQAVLAVDTDVFELVCDGKRVLVVLARVLHDQMAISLSDALVAHRFEHTIHLAGLLLRHQQILVLRLVSTSIGAKVSSSVVQIRRYGNLLALTHCLHV